MKQRICKSCGDNLPNSFFGHYYSSNCKLCNRLKEAEDLTDKEALRYTKVIQGLKDKRTIPTQLTWGQIKENYQVLINESINN